MRFHQTKPEWMPGTSEVARQRSGRWTAANRTLWWMGRSIESVVSLACGPSAVCAPILSILLGRSSE